MMQTSPTLISMKSFFPHCTLPQHVTFQSFWCISVGSKMRGSHWRTLALIIWAVTHDFWMLSNPTIHYQQHFNPGCCFFFLNVSRNDQTYFKPVHQDILSPLIALSPLGGAISNMYAMLLARFKMFPEVKEKGMSSVPRLVAFTSEHVGIHVSVQLHY